MPRLKDPIQIGRCALKHRILMAPMTRLRANDDHVPEQMVYDYYTQRASVPGTLLITEASFISPKSRGRDENAPGIFTKPQIEAWKTITADVHKEGSFIFMQLWHVGRAARAYALEQAGLDSVSSSDIPISSDFPTPRPMTEEEIWETINSFAQAAKNAIEAGFDGVELHAANGYLIDQFTQDVCNRRTDGWGGSIQNRSRFCLEVAKAVAMAIGPEKTGIRLSPFSDFQSMRKADPISQFTHLIKHLRPIGLAYLHLVEPNLSGNIEKVDTNSQDSLEFALDIWNKASPVIFAGGYSREKAEKTLDEHLNGDAVALAFGRHFISNPDLPFRLLNNVPLAEVDRNCFYDPKNPKGYADFPFSEEWKKVAAAAS